MLYRWVGFFWLESVVLYQVLSPNDQFHHEIEVPAEASVNCTSSGTSPDIGDPKAQRACEAGLQDPDEGVRWASVITAKKCQVPVAQIPWGISRRRRTGQNPCAASLLNFLFIGLGYNYLGYWWGFLVFMSYTSILVLAQLEAGPFLPYLIAYPITALFAVQTFYLAKKMQDL